LDETRATDAQTVTTQELGRGSDEQINENLPSDSS
jgi:hypothetical protein